LIIRGFKDIEIARQLNISIGTIRNYLAVIKRRIKAKNREQMVIYLLFFGHIDYEKIMDIFTTMEYN
jgi:DNA-binding CsgD family transcriptional regulator